MNFYGALPLGIISKALSACYSYRYAGG